MPTPHINISDKDATAQRKLLKYCSDEKEDARLLRNSQYFNWIAIACFRIIKPKTVIKEGFETACF